MALAAATGMALALAGCGPGGPGHGPPRRAGPRFPELAAGPAPAGWVAAGLPNGSAVLTYPPSMHLVAGDADSVSAARLSRDGGYLLYLNATPRQGTESLRDWPRFRLRLLRSDSASAAREISAASGIRFRGGTGSCIIDSYVTRIGAHQYDELACFVQGAQSASVIVAAAPAGRWAASAALLERAVAAYRVR